MFAQPTVPDRTLPADNCHIYGADGLGNSDFAVSELHHLHPSVKIISDEIRSAPEEVTIVCLGPLTNLAGAFRRDPAIAGQVGQLVIMGGAWRAGTSRQPRNSIFIATRRQPARYSASQRR